MTATAETTQPFHRHAELSARDPASDGARLRDVRRRHRFARWFSIGLVTAAVALGVFVRAYNLTDRPTWVDESESAINALTILETGLPRDTYRGLPIFENVMVTPWPDSAEYEFRELSYSEKGLATFHGWLPLYSIAAAQWALGVGTETLGENNTVQFTAEQVQRRVLAARLPSVVFSALFLVCLYLAGSAMAGRDAGWAALVLGGLSTPLVLLGREARYYSATLAFTTLLAYAMWQVHRRGRWQDYVIAALGFGLLFHTNILSFAVACAAMCLLLPGLLMGWRRSLPKLAVMGATVGAMTVPWLLLSGFLGKTAAMPPARTLLDFPADLVWRPWSNVNEGLPLLAAIAGLLAVGALHRVLPRRLVQPVAEHKWQLAFLAAWLTFGFLAFTLLIPASSYFYKRLLLAVLGPSVVFTGILLAVGVRVALNRPQPAVAAVLALLLLVGSKQVYRFQGPRPIDLEPLALIEHFRTNPPPPDARVYITPNEQLSLQYLAGIPAQGIAPVRKAFLDNHPGPVVIVEAFQRYELPDADRFAALAAGNGVSDPAAVESARRAAAMLATARPLQSRVASVAPTPPVPGWARPVADALPEQMRQHLENWSRRGTNTPMLRGFVLRDGGDWWTTFFYRFVDPLSRRDDKLNYADRARTGSAVVLNSTWAVITCPPLGSETAGQAVTTTVEKENE